VRGRAPLPRTKVLLLLVRLNFRSSRFGFSSSIWIHFLFWPPPTIPPFHESTGEKRKQRTQRHRDARTRDGERKAAGDWGPGMAVHPSTKVWLFLGSRACNRTVRACWRERRNENTTHCALRGKRGRSREANERIERGREARRDECPQPLSVNIIIIIITRRPAHQVSCTLTLMHLGKSIVCPCSLIFDLGSFRLQNWPRRGCSERDFVIGTR